MEKYTGPVPAVTAFGGPTEVDSSGKLVRQS